MGGEGRDCVSADDREGCLREGWFRLLEDCELGSVGFGVWAFVGLDFLCLCFGGFPMV